MNNTHPQAPEKGIPYKIRLGQTFLSPTSSGTYHSLLYSFKPFSVDSRGRLLKNATDGTLELELETKKQTAEQNPAASYFSGNFKTTNACVLLFEGPQKGFRLERLTTSGTTKPQRTRPLAWDEQTQKPLTPTAKVPSLEAKDQPLKRQKIDKSSVNNSYIQKPPTLPRDQMPDVVSTEMLPSVMNSDDEASSDDELLKDIEKEMERPDEDVMSETIEVIEPHQLTPEEKQALQSSTTPQSNTPPQMVVESTVATKNSSSSSSSSDSSSSSSSDSEPEQPNK